MNERIRELFAKTLDNDKIIANKAFGHWSLYEEDLEKFAELIVKECVNICEENSKTYKYSFTPMKARTAEAASKCCGELIKKRLGVKE
jgi:hypothetical protein